MRSEIPRWKEPEHCIYFNKYLLIVFCNNSKQTHFQLKSYPFVEQLYVEVLVVMTGHVMIL